MVPSCDRQLKDSWQTADRQLTGRWQTAKEQLIDSLQTADRVKSWKTPITSEQGVSTRLYWNTQPLLTASTRLYWNTQTLLTAQKQNTPQSIFSHCILLYRRTELHTYVFTLVKSSSEQLKWRVQVKSFLSKRGLCCRNWQKQSHIMSCWVKYSTF